MTICFKIVDPQKSSQLDNTQLIHCQVSRGESSSKLERMPRSEAVCYLRNSPLARDVGQLVYKSEAKSSLSCPVSKYSIKIKSKKYVLLDTTLVGYTHIFLYFNRRKMNTFELSKQFFRLF